MNSIKNFFKYAVCFLALLVVMLPMTVNAGNDDMVVSETDETPEGVDSFSEVYIQADGKEVKAWKRGDYLVFYAIVKGDKPYEGWFMYNVKTGCYIRYSSFMGHDENISYTDGNNNSDNNIDSLETLDYVALPKDLPNAFSSEVHVNINGAETKAAQYEDYLLFLAQGPSGTINWYLYDKKYGGIIKYRPYSVDNDTASNEGDDKLVDDDTDEYRDEYEDSVEIENDQESADSNISSVTVALLAVVGILVVVIIVLVIVIIKGAKRNKKSE